MLEANLAVGLSRVSKRFNVLNYKLRYTFML